MCRALKVLCAAADRASLAALKRACVAAHWELVGGAASVQDLERQLAEFEPDVVVVEAGLGDRAVAAVRAGDRPARLVALGSLVGADTTAAGLADVRSAILGLPRPGGPVMT